MPKLKLHEVTVLSVGADPRKVTEEHIEKLTKLQKAKQRLWSADEFLLQRKELFSRFFHHTGWGFVAEPTGQVKRWIDEMAIPVHPEFYSAIKRRVEPKLSETPVSDASKSMTRQERETLLKLIAAMSCEQYGYNPDAKRSEVPSSIKDDLERVGLGMDEKTIRKWLKEASGLVVAEYWQSGS